MRLHFAVDYCCCGVRYRCRGSQAIISSIQASLVCVSLAWQARLGQPGHIQCVMHHNTELKTQLTLQVHEVAAVIWLSPMCCGSCCCCCCCKLLLLLMLVPFLLCVVNYPFFSQIGAASWPVCTSQQLHCSGLLMPAGTVPAGTSCLHSARGCWFSIGSC